jgi:hypothetical protein
LLSFFFFMLAPLQVSVRQTHFYMAAPGARVTNLGSPIQFHVFAFFLTANMQEVSTSVAAAKIVYRQCASGMYPPFAYVLTAGFVSVPLFACECALLGLLIYFLSNCYASAGAFFTFAAILLTQCFNIAVWFRFISSAMPSEAAAQSIAGPSTGLFLLLGGFFVQFNAMPVWCVPFLNSRPCVSGGPTPDSHCDRIFIHPFSLVGCNG